MPIVIQHFIKVTALLKEAKAAIVPPRLFIRKHRLALAQLL